MIHHCFYIIICLTHLRKPYQPVLDQPVDAVFGELAVVAAGPGIAAGQDLDALVDMGHRMDVEAAFAAAFDFGERIVADAFSKRRFLASS